MHFNCKTRYYMENLTESHRRAYYLSRVITKNIRGLERWFNTQELLPLWQRTQNLHERQKSLVTLVSVNPTPSSDLLRWSLYMSPIHIQANTRTLKSQNSKNNSSYNMPWHTSKSFTYSGSKMGRIQGEINSNKNQKC